jgi:hypothetical protein
VLEESNTIVERPLYLPAYASRPTISSRCDDRR